MNRGFLLKRQMLSCNSQLYHISWLVQIDCIAFVWWSDSSVAFRDMETAEIQRPRCQTMQKYTFRMYEKKDKAYSVLTMSTERQATVVCHGCLFERQVEEKLEEKLLLKF